MAEELLQQLQLEVVVDMADMVVVAATVAPRALVVMGDKVAMVPPRVALATQQQPVTATKVLVVRPQPPLVADMGVAATEPEQVGIVVATKEQEGMAVQLTPMARPGRVTGTVLAAEITTTPRACSAVNVGLIRVVVELLPRLALAAIAMASKEVGWVTGFAPTAPITTMPHDRLVVDVVPPKPKRVWKSSNPNLLLAVLMLEWEEEVRGSTLAIGTVLPVTISTMLHALSVACVTVPNLEFTTN